MKFSELVLRARQYLFDVRESSGHLIDVASKDGIRWTSSHVQSLCRGAIFEMNRVLTAVGLYAYVDEASFYRLISGCSIQPGAGVGVLTFGAEVSFSTILKVQSSNLQQIFSAIPQRDFFAHRYLTQLISDSTRPIDDGVFSIFYDPDEKKKAVYTLPNFASPIEQVQAIARVPYSEVLTITSTDELPLVDTEDLLMLFIERNARRVEHNFDMVKVLTETIKDKIMEMTVGISRTTQ